MYSPTKPACRHRSLQCLNLSQEVSKILVQDPVLVDQPLAGWGTPEVKALAMVLMRHEKLIGIQCK